MKGVAIHIFPHDSLFKSAMQQLVYAFLLRMPFSFM